MDILYVFQLLCLSDFVSKIMYLGLVELHRKKNSVVLLQKQEAEDDGRDQRALRLQRGPTEAQTEKCQEMMAQKETGEKKLATEREKKGKQARQLAKHQALNQAVSENSGEQKHCSQGLVIHLLLDKI